MEAAQDLFALAEWMGRQGLGRGPVRDCVPLTGGTQNILLRFTLDGRAFVLRRPPMHPRANSNETMRREARVLGVLAGTGVPHPGLIAACEDESVLGAVFYLMEPVDGFNPAAGLPSLHAANADVQHRMGLALVEGIAALGMLDPTALGLNGFGKPEKFLERQVSRWRGQLEGYAAFQGWPGPGGLPGVETVAAWLETNRPADARPGILHGDYHLGNVMYRPDGPELAAIIDWELATIGDPLIDLGWLLATWPEPGEAGTVSVQPWIGFPTGDELVAHYAAHSDRDLSSIGWYRVLACYKLGILLEGSYARACAGQADMEIGEKLHGRAVRLFQRALNWIG